MKKTEQKIVLLRVVEVSWKCDSIFSLPPPERILILLLCLIFSFSNKSETLNLYRSPPVSLQNRFLAKARMFRSQQFYLLQFDLKLRNAWKPDRKQLRPISLQHREQKDKMLKNLRKKRKAQGGITESIESKRILQFIFSYQFFSVSPPFTLLFKTDSKVFETCLFLHQVTEAMQQV